MKLKAWSGFVLFGLVAMLSSSVAGQRLFVSAQLQQGAASQERKISSETDSLRTTADRLSLEAQSLGAQYQAESSRAAIRKYDEALKLWIRIGNQPRALRTRINIAQLYRDTGNLKRASVEATGAVTTAKNIREPLLEAEALLLLGSIMQRQGNGSKAMEAGFRALEIARALTDFRTEAEALYLIGTVLYEKGETDQAASTFAQAAAVAQTLNDKSVLARTMVYTSGIDVVQGRFDIGFERGQRALFLFKAIDDKQGQARSLTLLGNILSRVGRKQEALTFHEQARTLLQNSGDLFYEESLLLGMARVYQDLGDYSAALNFFTLGLDKSIALADRMGSAQAMRAIGQSYLGLQDFQNALFYLERALAAFRALNSTWEAFVLRDIGFVYNSRGDNHRALEYLNHALELSRAAKQSQLETSALIGIGRSYETDGDVARALESYGQALHLSEAGQDQLGRLTALSGITRSLRQMGRLEEALTHIESAIDSVEKLRSSVSNAGLRTSYFASAREQYELFIDLLMRLHSEHSTADDINALEASESSRARSLLDSIAEARFSITEGVDAQQLDRQLSLQTLLDTKAEAYARLLSSRAEAGAVKQVTDEIQRLTAEYDELQAQIRIRSPRYASLVQPELLKLDQIQNILDGDSLLLEYALGQENSYLWAVTREGFTSYVLPARSQIEKIVGRLRELMTSRAPVPGERAVDYQARLKAAESQYPKLAAEVSQMLLGPVASRLGERRLVIVADGVLQYLPFGSLPTPQSLQSSSPTPLVVEHEIVNLPSASTLAVIRREAPLRGNPDRTIAVFADPVFDKSDGRVNAPVTKVSSPQSNPGRALPSKSPTLTGVVQSFRGSEGVGIKLDLPRLTATKQEAEAILSMVPEDRRMAALGFNATKAVAMNPDLKRYRIVHFATHTILNDDHPDLSSLVLSLVDEKGNPQSGFLRLRDMYNLQLAAELVVLSACDTALGKEVKGEGLMSMVRGFMYSGTPRVLASLWKVDDEATAELMKEFYTHLLQEGMKPAAALRQAQITQMRKKSRQSPYYWAGFQLQGEWN